MKKNYSQNVCQLLAEQLIYEQAEVQKHEALVDNIKQTIIDMKMKVIMEFVKGKLFNIGGKKFAVINISVVKIPNGAYVVVNLAQEPMSAVEGLELNEKEAKLMSDYKEVFDFYQYTPDDQWDVEISKSAIALAEQEHELHLLDSIECEFDFADATEPEFYTKTGVYIDSNKGTNGEKLMLEDVVVRNINKRSLAPGIHLKLV